MTGIWVQVLCGYYVFQSTRGLLYNIQFLLSLIMNGNMLSPSLQTAVEPDFNTPLLCENQAHFPRQSAKCDGAIRSQTEVFLVLIFLYSIIVSYQSINVPNNLTNPFRVERFSTILRKSFSDVGCHIHSSSCRSCTQFPHCRYCFMKALGANRLLIEKGATGKSQLVGICFNVLSNSWSVPISLKDGNDEPNEIEEDEDSVIAAPQYAECGLFAPDYHRGFTCWDLELAKERVAYRDALEKTIPADINPQTITQEARLASKREEGEQEMTKGIENENMDDTELPKEPPPGRRVSQMENPLDAIDPYEGIFMSLVLPISAILFTSICATIVTGFCGVKGCCCCLCVNSIKFIRGFKRRFIYRNTSNSGLVYPISSNLVAINPIDDNKSFKSPRFFQTGSDLSTTVGSLSGHSTLNKTIQAFVPSNNRLNYIQTLNAHPAINDTYKKTFPDALYQLQIERDFFNPPTTSTTAQLNTRSSVDQKRGTSYVQYPSNHLGVPHAVVMLQAQRQHCDTRPGLNLVNEEQILIDAIDKNQQHNATLQIQQQDATLQIQQQDATLQIQQQDATQSNIGK